MQSRRITKMVAATLLFVSMAIGIRADDGTGRVRESDRHAQDLSLLRSYDQKAQNASPDVKAAAERVFGGTLLLRLTADEVIERVGQPLQKSSVAGRSVWTFAYSDGRSGPVYCVWFDQVKQRVFGVEVRPTA